MEAISENERGPRQGIRKRHPCVNLLVLVLCTLPATGCQELDPRLASGASVVSDTDSGTSTSGNGGSGPAGGDAVPCDVVRLAAHATLETYCAYCHQAPGNATSVYQGEFNFILELDKLTSLKSNVFSGMSFVAAGSPENSLVYQRISNGQMPPTNITLRPGASELAALRMWITSCIDGSSTGWRPT